jgi:hypothetical protein
MILQTYFELLYTLLSILLNKNNYNLGKLGPLTV